MAKRIVLNDDHAAVTLHWLEAEPDGTRKVQVEIRTAWLFGRLTDRLRKEESENLAESLHALAEAAAGSTTFRAQENWLEATFAMAKKDELHLSLRLQSAPDYLNELRLFLDVPQSRLPEIVDWLRSAPETLSPPEG